MAVGQVLGSGPQNLNAGGPAKPLTAPASPGQQDLTAELSTEHVPTTPAAREVSFMHALNK